MRSERAYACLIPWCTSDVGCVECASKPQFNIKFCSIVYVCMCFWGLESGCVNDNAVQCWVNSFPRGWAFTMVHCCLQRCFNSSFWCIIMWDTLQDYHITVSIKARTLCILHFSGLQQQRASGTETQARRQRECLWYVTKHGQNKGHLEHPWILINENRLEEIPSAIIWRTITVPQTFVAEFVSAAMTNKTKQGIL